MGNTIREKLNSLSETDVYSMILFALYKLIDDPKYSTLSELAYILDRENLLKFLECFGGLTIRVPSVDELNLVTNALLLYELTHLENYSMEEALEQINLDNTPIKSLRATYATICDILANYDFKRS